MTRPLDRHARIAAGKSTATACAAAPMHPTAAAAAMLAMMAARAAQSQSEAERKVLLHRRTDARTVQRTADADRRMRARRGAVRRPRSDAAAAAAAHAGGRRRRQAADEAEPMDGDDDRTAGQRPDEQRPTAGGELFLRAPRDG